MSKSLIAALEDAEVSLSVLKALSDNSFDSILVTDSSAAGKILYANRAFKKLTGYAPAEVIGKTPRMLQGPATDKAVLARVSKAIKEGGRFEGKAINYRKNGTPFIMHWRIVPAKIGKNTKVWLAIQREGTSVD